MKHNHLHTAKRWLLALSFAFFASAQAQVWTRDAILTAPVNLPISDEVGLFATGMVANDQTLAVSQGISAVLVYQRDTAATGGWALQQTLTLPPGGPAIDDSEFGRFLALSGDTLAISAAKQLTSGELETLVYLYQRSGNTWALQHSIRPDDASSASWFGLNIALDGSTLAVTAVDATDIRTGQSVYAFTLSGGSWQQRIKWQPGTNNTSTASEFGGRLAVDNGVVAIGDTGLGDQRNGAVHLMMPNGDTWTQQIILPAIDATPARVFGEFDIADNQLVIGATPYSHDSTGAALVYTRSGDNWTLAQTLTLDNGQSNDGFGEKVAIDGDHLLVSNLEYNANELSTAEVYAFTFDGTVWQQQQKLDNTDIDATQLFGAWIDLQLHNQTAAIPSLPLSAGDNLLEDLFIHTYIIDDGRIFADSFE